MNKVIMDYIINNEKINNYLSKQSDDLKQEFYLQIMEYMLDINKYNKIILLYKKGELGQYCMGIIRNTLKNNSPYSLKYYNPKVSLTNDFNLDLTDDDDITILQIKKDKEDREEVDRIIKLLNNMDPYNGILYKLRIGVCPITGDLVEPKTYKEIQDLIGLSYVSVRNSCIRTEKIIKNSTTI